jgi:hypothetical protein
MLISPVLSLEGVNLVTHVRQDTEGTWDKWLVADVVCHEVAHQWFGNLVTCSDWQDLTVNEVHDMHLQGSESGSSWSHAICSTLQLTITGRLGS